jgi:hypothetical protein
MIMSIQIRIIAIFYLNHTLKKSYNRFEFSYAFYKGSDYYPYSVGYSWDFIIIEVLPKMKADGLYNNSINQALINLDKIALHSKNLW